ncbi:hypothetical protein BC936DRAFT_145085 [Jimgerdemannia flammicorona]|uniref:Uncharacterized protein n=1 Tax=Jimgerdemannia flammicorona TaxID=994334 RepID=A0A433DAY1_9FUNG|nr:hypothetical protein BC936DRAFT_145085 [Jimgerdemannia flammicorona]
MAAIRTEVEFVWPTLEQLSALLPSIRELWSYNNEFDGIYAVGNQELQEWAKRQELMVAIEAGTTRVIATLRMIITIDPAQCADLVAKFTPPMDRDPATMAPSTVEIFNGRKMIPVPAFTSVEPPFHYHPSSTLTRHPVFLYFGTVFTHPEYRTSGLGSDILQRAALHHLPTLAKYTTVENRPLIAFSSTANGYAGDRNRQRYIRLNYIFCEILARSCFSPPRKLTNLGVTSWGFWTDSINAPGRATAVTFDPIRHTVDRNEKPVGINDRKRPEAVARL